MGTVGKLVHIGVDLVLVSAFMAGVKRSTGLSFKTTNVENKDAQTYLQKYLNVGEWVFDTSVAFMGSSEYFERKR